MFKNRVRTAALAGAIAVATGVSGVAVPAFAEDTNVNSIQGPEFNKPDASKAEDAKSENYTEKQLLDLTDATDKFIQSYNQYQDLYPKVAALAGDGVDISEEQEYKDFQEFANKTTEQLAQAEKNVQAARASVAYALEKDKAADAAWNNYEEKAFDYNVTVTNVTGVKNGGNNPHGDKGSQYETDEYKQAGLLATDIAKANAYLREANGGQSVEIKDDNDQPMGTMDLTAPNLKEIDPNNFWSTEKTPKDNLEKFEDAIKEYKLRLAYAGDRAADKTPGNYIPRDYIGYLETVISDAEMLYEQLKADTAAVTEARDAAREASRESQKSDVLVRQGLLDRAWAQVYVLRPMEAQFAIGARVLELYESGENGTVVINGEQLTLRQAYERLIQEDGNVDREPGTTDKDGTIQGPNYVNEAINENYEAYKAATTEAVKIYDTFPGDLQGIDGRGICGPRDSRDEVAVEADGKTAKDAEDPFKSRKKDCSEPLDKVFFDGASNRNDEAKKYVQMKIAAAKRLFGPNNFNLAWEEEYKKVLNADNGVQKAISDDAAAAKDREEQAELAKKNADAAARIADALEKQNNGGNKDGDADKGGDDNNKGDNNKGDNNKKGDKGSAKDKLSNNGKPTPLAIFGIVAGVLAAVAAAFPAIAKALNIKLPF